MHKIKNLLLDSLGFLSLEKIYQETIEFNKEEIKIKNQSFSIGKFDNYVLLGIGKAASNQVSLLSKHLHTLKLPQLEGLIITKHGHGEKIPHHRTIEASHPYCDESSLKAGNELISFLQNLSEKTLLIVCLSGGASALVVKPIDGLSLEDKNTIFKKLLKSGLDILSINLLRKELSQIKNGGIPFHTKAQTTITLAISDVPSHDFSMIGSGPTLYQDSDPRALAELIEKYLEGSSKKTVLNYLQSSKRKEVTEQKIIKAKNSHFFVISDFESYAQKLRSALTGEYEVEINTLALNLNEQEGIEHHLDILQKNLKKRKYIYVSGGEIPIKVTGKGLGGRNSHFVCAMGYKLFTENFFSLSSEQLSRISVYSLASDGTDGPTDYAGGWLNNQVIFESALSLKDFLSQNNTLNYLINNNAAFKTGPTGTNIMDIRLICIE